MRVLEVVDLCWLLGDNFQRMVEYLPDFIALSTPLTCSASHCVRIVSTGMVQTCSLSSFG